MLYLVIAKVVARPERRQDLADLLTQMAVDARSEKDCLSYVFAADLEDGNSFFSVETWTHQEALKIHVSRPEVAAALPKINDLVAQPSSIIGYQVDGDPVKLA